MKRSSELSSLSLVWNRRTTRILELTAGEALLAGLKFEKVGGSLATGHSPGGKWTLWRIGFPKARTYTRVGTSKRNVAILEPGSRTGGAPLAFADGRSFLWQPAKDRRQDMTFANATGKTIARFRAENGPGFRVGVEIERWARDLPELWLLLLLGGYTLISLHNDKQAAAAKAKLLKAPTAAE